MTAPHFALGHVVLNVASLERSIPFYRDALGMREVARGASEQHGPGAGMVFFSFGTSHHDIALREVPAATPAGREGVGLFHIAVRIGNSLAELRAYQARLARLGVRILRARDHRVSQSIYFEDPDNLLVEAYVDADPEIWRADPGAVATGCPLKLD